MGRLIKLILVTEHVILCEYIGFFNPWVPYNLKLTRKQIQKCPEKIEDSAEKSFADEQITKIPGE